MATKIKLVRNLLTGAALCGFLASPTWAQDSAETPEPQTTVDESAEEALVDAATEATEEIAEPEPQASGRQDKITITGSLLRRDEFTSASPIQVITADKATMEGLITAADILQGSSIAAGSVQLNNQFGGFVIDGGLGVNTISLRGLGDQRTLVLLNGRRPGPSGTRGAVGAFDLNVLPDAAINRVEILKDGASSVLGSDAVGGVVNIITRTAVDRPELAIQFNQPMESGGEQMRVEAAAGLNFDTGNFTFFAQYLKEEDLSLGDRDYLQCDEDFVTGIDGSRIDRQDRSINAGTLNDNCSNIYANTVINAFAFGQRFIPSPDGVTIGPLDGFRPRTNASYATSPDGQAFFEDDLYDERVNSANAFNEQELISLYTTGDFTFDVLGGLNWKGEALYTNRKTSGEQWRQFFPYIGDGTAFAYDQPYDGNPFAFDPFLLDTTGNPGIVIPIIAFPSNDEVDLDYIALASTLEGGFSSFGEGVLDDWIWSIDATYSKSDGDYTGNEILIDQSGDWLVSSNAPTFNPFDPAVLSGEDVSWYNQVQSMETGNTVYEQTAFKLLATGPLFEFPTSGEEVLFAVGAEQRDYEIDDQPSENSIAGNLWGTSSSLETVGEESVTEFFAEVEFPIFKGQSFAEDLNLNLSGRTFEYDTFGSGDVWKAQLNWQMIPALRFRATEGTSFRAPALFETYQGRTTAFQSQAFLDPCIQWGFPEGVQNPNIPVNCAALGIPPDYTGAASSATIVSSGGGDLLEPETATTSTLGVVFTPSFADISIAIDYFSIEVEDQVAQLGAGTIVGACLVADNFPNGFCDLFDRNGPDDLEPFSITEVRNAYLNINNQKTSGFDITVLYEKEFDFGLIEFEGRATFTDEDEVELFSASEGGSGFDTNDFNGTIGEPQWVWDTSLSLERGDFTYFWSMDYIGEGDNSSFDAAVANYQGITGVFDIKTEEVLYHDVSIEWETDDWTLTGGFQNVFDEEPPTISTSNITNRRGLVPLSAGYDLRGRTAFVRVERRF